MSYESSGDPPNPMIYSETKSPPQPPWTLINLINLGSSSRTYFALLVLLIHSFCPKKRYWMSNIEAPKSNHRLMLTSCILPPNWLKFYSWFWFARIFQIFEWKSDKIEIRQKWLIISSSPLYLHQPLIFAPPDFIRKENEAHFCNWELWLHQVSNQCQLKV